MTALLNIIVFANTLRKPRAWLAAIAISILVLFVAMLYATVIKSFAQGQLYADQVVFSKQTVYQNIILTRNEFDGEHRLYVDGHLQFAEKDEYRYHEALVHPVMSMEGMREQILILGGGDGLAAREVLKYDEVKSIDLVDIDPEITNLCRDFPAIRKLNQGALSNHKLQIHNVDAFQFLRGSKQLFDRIIIDLPDPHNEALSKLYSEEFLFAGSKATCQRRIFRNSKHVSLGHSKILLDDRAHHRCGAPAPPKLSCLGPQFWRLGISFGRPQTRPIRRPENYGSDPIPDR